MNQDRSGAPRGEFTTPGDVLARVISDALRRSVTDVSPDVDTLVTSGLQEGLGMDESLAEAYLTSMNAVHATGLAGFDEVTTREINIHKAHSAQSFPESYAFMRKPADYYAAQLAGHPKRAKEEFLNGPLDWGSPVIRNWVEETVARQDSGVATTPLLGAVMRLHRLTYAPELGNREPALVGAKDQRLISLIFSDPELQAGISQMDLSQRLRDGGAMDISEERLGARTENMLALMQLEVSLQYLRNLEDMWACRGLARAAGTALFKRHGRDVLRDDYPAKLRMLAEVGSTLQSFGAKNKVKGRERVMLDAMGHRARSYLDGLAAIHADFVTIYQAFGYDMPASLVAVLPQEVEQEVEPTPVAEAAGVIVVEATVASGPDPEVVDNLQQRATVLGERVAHADRAWIMTGKERKNTGLDGAVRVLMAGCTDVTGRQLLPNMDRHQAEELVAVLRRLNAMGERSPADGQQALQTALTRRTELAAEITALYREAQDSAPGGQVTYPSLIPVEPHLERFRADWSRYEQVLLSIWPPQTVRQTITNIQKLLFPPQPA